MKKILITVMTLIMSMSLLTACGGGNTEQGEETSNSANTAEAVAVAFRQADERCDAKTKLSLLPKEALDWLIEQSEWESKAELLGITCNSYMELCEKTSEETKKVIEETQNIKVDEITCKAIGHTDEKPERFGHIYPDLDLGIEEAKIVIVEVTRPKTKGMDEIKERPTCVVKIDGKWYAYER